MYKEALRAAWAEINLKNFDYNVKQIRAKMGNDREFIGVIKADGYGHGAIQCAEVLRENGVKTFAIATLQEAIELRNAGAGERIICLGLTPDMYADTLIDYDIIPVICDSSNAKAISDAAAAKGKYVDCLITVDTGMGRIGYLADDYNYAIEDIKKIAVLPNVRILGLFSHMATADAYDKTFAHQQEMKYNKFYEAVTEAGIPLSFRTLANSASIMELPTLLFDGCRPGIILYGQYPSQEVDRNQLDIKPVMQIKANILHLKYVPVGFSCGYARKFIAERPSTIATIGLGYADGYPRPFSADAKVIVNGHMCKVAGNICMDQFMVDVTDVPNVKVGDEIIVMGSDGVNTISAEDIANATGTINYEITCAFGQRLPKVFVK